eukprot:1398418-Ditylum_brightwellii.AAC.1
MPRCCGTGRNKPMKKQTVSNMEQDSETSVNDNRSVIDGQCNEMENKDFDEFECDSISNNHYSFKNTKVRPENHHIVSKLN